VRQGFQNFYDNKDGLQDKYLKYWEVLAEYFADNEYVIGFDILNEPWPSTISNETEMFMQFDEDILAPLYDDISATIRAKDDKKVLFFQSGAFPTVIPQGAISQVGFSTSPGGKRYQDYSALSQHAYCCQHNPDYCRGTRTLGEISGKKGMKACTKFIKEISNSREVDASDLGIPIFFTEFGACSGSKACLNEINNVVNAANTVSASWAYYQFKGFNDYSTQYGNSKTLGMYQENGKVDEDKLFALTGTYA
jgi:endoglycosylceramidase